MSDFEIVVTPAPPVHVEIDEGGASPVVVELPPPPPSVVEVRVPGPQGPQGPPGELVEGSGDLSYVHVQAVPATTWPVEHGLGKFPSVSAFDSAGTPFEGVETHVDENNLSYYVGPAPFSGRLYLN